MNVNEEDAETSTNSSQQRCVLAMEHETSLTTQENQCATNTPQMPQLNGTASQLGQPFQFSLPAWDSTGTRSSQVSEGSMLSYGTVVAPVSLPPQLLSSIPPHLREALGQVLQHPHPNPMPSTGVQPSTSVPEVMAPTATLPHSTNGTSIQLQRDEASSCASEVPWAQQPQTNMTTCEHNTPRTASLPTASLPFVQFQTISTLDSQNACEQPATEEKAHVRSLEATACLPERSMDYVPIRQQREPHFPIKLHELLSNEQCAPYISWNYEGTCWRISKPALFELNVLPLYFRYGAKVKSFSHPNPLLFASLDTENTRLLCGR